jgi:ankyrin repeat protein
MEIEKQELAARMSNNEHEIKAASEARSSQLQAEQEELRAKIQLLADEKNQLHNQLKSAEEQALVREKANNERLQQEREELMKTVQRMKEELREERSKQVAPAEKATACKPTDDNPFNISPNTSLYELLEESAANSAPRNNDKTHNLDPKAMASHTITTIAEVEDEESKKSDAERIREELVGLPAPHIAAAMGELIRLKNFADVEASLLASFDADHRTPLFYASAYAQYDTVKFLVDLKACDVLEVDVNGDTALHAATSSGSIPCIEIILAVKKIAVHKKNAMGMTPGHLAKSAECLRVLYRNGADLASVDNNGRSPLFVACAMNRVDCAEYLIDCLDLDDAALLICDSRGDTPLHASACNGSVDCLLLLLQHGIDPMITNTKGLKAIDLAIRNKHVKCRELLAEYHLHFCTGSDFDSVLFLATLEGHRHVKNTVRSTGSEQYDIIKRQGGSGIGASVMKKARSMYSLNHNRSLRLQRWGSWIAYEDQEDHSKTYWYNQRTGEGQYEKPEKVAAMQDDQQKVIDKYGSESLAVNVRKLNYTPVFKCSVLIRRIISLDIA